MAIIFANSSCAICGLRIDTNANFFATSGAVFGPSHPLYHFCDAPMHWECYVTWPHRPEFAHGYFQAGVDDQQNNPYWGMAFLSEQVAVTVNPDPSVAQVSVDLAATGSSVRVPLAQWEAWVAGSPVPDSELHDLERETLAELLPELRTLLPDAEAVVAQVDWAAKRELLRAERERTRQSEQVRLKKTSAHNKACRQMVREGVACPRCGNGQNIRFQDKSPQGKSYFICNDCARSFGPVEQTLWNQYREAGLEADEN